MNPFKFYGIAIFFTLASTISHSQELPRSTIEKILHTYASTVGCTFEMDQKNIIEIDIDGDGDKEFVALYIYDFGYCEGSGSWASNLAVLEPYDNPANKKAIYVLPEMTMPVISGIGLPRFIDRIFIKDGQLWFAGRIHADRDGNNFPTIPVQARIQLLHSDVKVDSKNMIGTYYWKSSIDFTGK